VQLIFNFSKFYHRLCLKSNHKLERWTKVEWFRKTPHWIVINRTLCGLINGSSISEEHKTFRVKQLWISWPSRQKGAALLEMLVAVASWHDVTSKETWILITSAVGTQKSPTLKYTYSWLAWAPLLCCRSPNNSLILIFAAAYFSPPCALSLWCTAATHTGIYTTFLANPQGLKSRGVTCSERGDHGISPACPLCLPGNSASE
jgi:hypothetical protein